MLVSGRDWQQYQDPDAVLSQVPALSATPAGKNKAIHAIDGHALQGASAFVPATGEPDRPVDQAGFLMRLPLPWLLALTGCALALLLVGSLATGPMSLSLGESLRALFAGPQSGIEAHKLLIVQEIRLPRTLLCIAVGAFSASAAP